MLDHFYRHGVAWIPQVFFSTQTLPLILCLCFPSISALPTFVSIILWLLSQSVLVYLLSLLGFLASGLYPFKSTLSVNWSWCNVFRYGGHLFCNGRDYWHVEIPKMSFLYLHREIHKNTIKSSKLLFIRLQILSIPPYNPIESAFGLLSHANNWSMWSWSNSWYSFRAAYVYRDYLPKKAIFSSHMSASGWDWEEPI